MCNQDLINNENNNLINHLFFKIWHNCFIRNKILKYLKIFNIYYYERFFYSLKEFENYQNKEYLRKIFIFSHKEYFNQQINQENNFKLLPNNIEIIKSYDNDFKETIPNYITNLEIRDSFEIKIFRNLNNLKYLKINLDGDYIPEIKENELPESLEELSFGGYSYTIKKEILPQNLKKLSIGRFKEIESLNDSLEEFECVCKSFKKKNFRKSTLPNSLKSLIINYIGDDYINLDLSFLNKLENLKIYSKSINKIILPNNEMSSSLSTLKQFELASNEVKEIIKFPNSLERLIIIVKNLSNQQLQFNHKMIPKNLKYLLFNGSFIIDSNGYSILPNSLEYLELNNSSNSTYNNYYFKNLFNLSIWNKNEYIKDNVFGVNIKHINLGNKFNEIIGLNILSNCKNLKNLILGDDYDQKIDINTFPDSLKTLVFGKKFNQSIEPESIPFNLKLLVIKNPQYNHSINLLNPMTLVDSQNYYKQFENTPQLLKSFKVPLDFDLPLKSLSLHNKINLELFVLNSESSSLQKQHFQLEDDLPIKSNLKYLNLGNLFIGKINLEHFQKLEIIKIGYSNPEIITTFNYNTNDYNFYNLKKIIVPNNNVKFLDSINNKLLLQFIKLKKSFK